ncbi:apolipoprotein D-like [Triplophysa dalaica]|uniref:apolipoprotein D-like n=1 Tax=Triplophysa dalaica TaxID=1582913 RepID=UPI0024DFC265|nr:apolipoprotein D-like [Triplophysa dalaica]
MQTLHVVSLTLLCVLAVNAQSIGSGKCPQPPVQQNFDPAKYMGRWYGIKKIPNTFQSGECSRATYALSDNTVLVRNEQLLPNGNASFIDGTAKILDPSQPAKLEVRFFEDRGAPYWVLATDYDNYTLVYSCSETLDLSYAEYAWIMSRTRTLPKETITELLDILKSNNINTALFTETDQRPELCSGMP